MLYLHLKSLKPIPPTSYPSNNYGQNYVTNTLPPAPIASKGVVDEKNKIHYLFFEASRRNMIIQKAAATCPYKEGDICLWAKGTQAQKDRYGEVTVQKICRSYAHYGKDVPWPDHERPLIVTATFFDKETKTIKSLFCSVDMLVKKVQIVTMDDGGSDE